MSGGDYRTQFGTLSADGGYTLRGSVAASSMLACPFVLIDFEHYRADGSCKCDDELERERLIRDYDYTPEDFAAIPLREGGGDNGG